MPKYDIIIAHYGIGRLTDLCCRCLETIRDCSTDYRVILIDNGSPELDRLIPTLETIPHLLVQNSVNLGFIKATNQGIALSTAPYVVLMNNDTEAVPEWLEKLRMPLAGQVGLSGPRTTTQGSWQGRWPARSGVYVLPETAMLAFFCVMIRRDVIEKCGPLDEIYGVGFGDDDAYSWQAHQKGFRLALVQDLVIPHHHRSTFHYMYGEDKVAQMQEAARQLYRRSEERRVGK